MSTPPDRNERLLRGLAALKTPEQQKLARSIYDRLYAGESLDDVKGLIEEMAQVIKEEHDVDSGGSSGETAGGSGG